MAWQGMTAMAAGSLLSGLGKDPTYKYKDPRSAQQIELANLTAAKLSELISGSGRLPADIKSALLGEILGAVDLGYDQGLKYLENTNLDPLSKQRQELLMGKDRAKALAQGGQAVASMGSNMFNQALSLGGQVGFASPPQQFQGINTGQNFGTNLAGNLGDILGHYGGKAVGAYGTNKGWW